MRILETKVYEFNELSEEAKKKARLDHANFLIEISSNYYDNEGNVKKDYEGYFVVEAIKRMERMKTPWFLAETLYFDYQKEIDEEIILNEYEFTEGGELI